MDWFALLEKLVYIAVMISLSALTYFLKEKGVISKIQKIQLSDDIKQHAAYLAVLFAQQVYEDNEEKYFQASQFISKYLSERGIKVTEEEIRILIESALKQAKAGFKEMWE